MIFSSSDILSPIQLKRLSEHKYSSSGQTFLDPLVQPFWNWIVQRFPLWISPNALTVAGLLVNIIMSVILVCFSPDATHEAPRWACALSAVGLFIYQTLDGCDGKQARRTGTSSPLGELFDHGCDSVSTVFLSLSVAVAIELGTYPTWMFFQSFSAITLFYSAHWQTYVSGTLRFGRFDATEAQWCIIIIFLTSAIFGSSIWSITIPSLYIELKLFPVFIGLIAASVAFYANFTKIFTGGVGKNGSTVAGTSILSPLIPMALILVSAVVIYQKSSIYVSEISKATIKDHSCLYILAFGMVASKITVKLVLAHMTKSEIECIDSVFVGPGMLFLNQYFNTFIDEYIVLWLCLIYTCADFFHYCFIVSNQICSFLHIHLFRIVPSCSNNSDAITHSSASTSPLLQRNNPNDGSPESSVIIIDEP